MSAITTHVLDTSKGRPGSGIQALLEQLSEGGWCEIGSGTTDQNGRISTFLPSDYKLVPGTYKLTFDTESYFGAQSTTGFYPYVQITFLITEPGQHYHVPLLLSPFGYSTYRGS